MAACADSGKTEVVAQRVAALLKAGAGTGLAPRNIVAFTFTEKVAAELKDRIVMRVAEVVGEVNGLGRDVRRYYPRVLPRATEDRGSRVPQVWCSRRHSALKDVPDAIFVDLVIAKFDEQIAELEAGAHPRIDSTRDAL
jgi:DNA helicase-2/ATP-dependent DNA helicase PcrA